ncbi:MAG: hypothetical protein H7Z13_20170 [Ferruginibacter sp.]|nr:hypothetical protein [Ferruginibacter sp.]
MSGFPILDLVVGMIFIFFMLSIISSSAIELILTGMKARSIMLEEWLFKIFDKTIKKPDGTEISLGQSIMDHCSVTALSGTGKSTSYIDAKNFTSALLEKISFDPANPQSVAKNIDEFIAAIDKTNLLSTEFQRVLLIYAHEAKDTYKAVSEKTVSEIELFRDKVESWYDSSMDRISGKLKTRYSRPATFVVAVIVTCLLNADSIAIAKYLYSNPEARTKVAMQGYDAGKDTALIKRVQQLRATTPDTLSKDAMGLGEIKEIITSKITEIDKAKQGLSDVMPLTWKAGELKDGKGNYSGRLIFSKITGLLATILAIMMGAPFWFDLLNKISNLRGTGAKPASTGGEAEKKK